MKKLFFLVTLLISLFSSSCDNDAALMELANELSKKFIITDGHIDLPYRLNGKYQDISGLFEGGDFDYLRAKKGALMFHLWQYMFPHHIKKRVGPKKKQIH